MTKEEQGKRLAAAYYGMSPRGREALDRIVRRLTDLHGAVARKLPAGTFPGKGAPPLRGG
jgi:DNA-binding PadR family transcriptional regulator